MKITGLPATVGLLFGAALVVAQERPEVPTFASKVELVTVDAVVVDGKDRPVRGLRADDFVLLEDGKPQKVESFEANSGFSLQCFTVASTMLFTALESRGSQSMNTPLSQ